MGFADQRVLRNVAAVLSVTFVDQDGTPAPPSGAVTVGVTRVDGTVVLAPGAATGTGSTAGVRTVPLTAAQNGQLDYLTCTWTAASGEIATSHVDVVGAYYFSLADLRTLDGLSGLSDEQLRIARQAVEEMVEIRTGWVWTPRLAVETIEVVDIGWFGQRVGYPSSLTLTRRPIRALRQVAIDTVPATLTDWSHDNWGLIGLTHNWATYNTRELSVIYEVGEDRPPRQLVQALIGAARQTELDAKSGIGARVLSEQNQFGNINYARATVDNLFGNPTVDAVLAFWDRRMPRMASA